MLFRSRCGLSAAVARIKLRTRIAVVFQRKVINSYSAISIITLLTFWLERGQGRTSSAISVPHAPVLRQRRIGTYRVIGREKGGRNFFAVFIITRDVFF